MLNPVMTLCGVITTILKIVILAQPRKCDNYLEAFAAPDTGTKSRPFI